MVKSIAAVHTGGKLGVICFVTLHFKSDEEFLQAVLTPTLLWVSIYLLPAF
jgi:hypothetical protein